VVETQALRMMNEPSHAQGYLRARVPLQRTGRAAEIAEACLFLSGPAGSYITGQTLVVDGGAICA
jgi:NAD(P)-dependent dehydrogenase (short-subunit alcohol dehydrogenase family)